MFIKKFEKIPEVLFIKPSVFNDERGCFVETYNMGRYFSEAKIIRPFVQDNLSVSKKFVVRGLHWQNAPFAQGKLVSVVRGEVFDVAVDVRKNSPTFGQWVGEVLTAHGHEQLYIPPGFAHGFQALDDDTVFCYKCTDMYDKNSEGSLLWNDPDVGITWLYPDRAIVSDKDRQAKTLKELKDMA